MKTKKKWLYAVLALLIQGAGAAYGQSPAGNDTVKTGQQTGEVSYAGIKMEKVGESNLSATAGQKHADGRVINDTELTYSGKWEFNRLLPRSGGYFCNTRSYAQQNGATASCLLNDCEGIRWYAKPVAGAVAEVYIDGKLVKTVDCAKPAADGLLFDSGALSRGDHRLVIVAKSGAVEIDWLLCKGKPAGPVQIDAGNRSFVQYTAGFRLTPADLQRAQSVAEATLSDEEWELCAKGGTVRCYGETGPDGGTMQLYVNDKPYRTVNCYSKVPQKHRLLFTVDHLMADQYNRIKGIVVSKGKRVALERFVTDDPSCLMVEMNRQTDEELAQMARHAKKASDPSGWKPVGFEAVAPVRGVKLEDGVFKTIFDRNIRYLEDCLRKPNWVDAKDQDRIWIDMLMGSNEGRMLGGMGHTLRFRDVPAFSKAIEDILEQIDRRQFANGNGYLMPYQSLNYKLSTDTWPGVMRDEQKNYDRAMLTKGLLAAGLGGHERGYRLLRPFYDWFNNAKEYLPLMLLGSMGIQGSIAGPMVYHSPVGKPEDIQTNMKYYDMDWWLNDLAQGLPEAAWRFTLNRPHNYLLTSVCALFDIYKATGSKRYLNAALGAWRIYSGYFQIPGGGISLCEHFECRPKSHVLTNLPNNIYETCGSVFWIDLNHRFLQLWPTKERYASEIEKSLYNVVFAAQGENGCIRYFNQVNDAKYPAMCYNTCCEIQATALYGMLPQYVYSVAPDGVFVNLFSASDIDFKVKDQPVKLTMKTQFPYSNQVALRVSADRPVTMKVRVRIPEWAKGGVVLRVNDRKVKTGMPGSYVEIDRTWKDNDEITWILPMTWSYEKYIGATRIAGATRYAFFYGPMLMALQGPMMKDAEQAPNEPSVKFDVSPDEFLKRIKATDKPCEFTVEGMPDYRFTPYFSLQGGNFTCFPGLRQAE